MNSELPVRVFLENRYYRDFEVTANCFVLLTRNK